MVASDAALLTQDVDFAALGDAGLYRGLDLLFVADVQGESAAYRRRLVIFIDQFVQLV